MGWGLGLGLWSREPLGFGLDSGDGLVFRVWNMVTRGVGVLSLD